jgi:hypothetical protein
MMEVPKGNREQWDEQHAVECDRMVDSYAQMLVERTAKLQSTLAGSRIRQAYAYIETADIHSIATQMHTWHVMADRLRKPRRIRIEQEAYSSCTP